jgi:hypothetical protein
LEKKPGISTPQVPVTLHRTLMGPKLGATHHIPR